MGDLVAEEDHDDEDEDVCFDCGQIHDDCECHAGDDCGRWRNGNLSASCSKAGSEECDFECPLNGVSAVQFYARGGAT